MRSLKPRDIIIICLLETCDILRFVFQQDDETEKRIELICKDGIDRPRHRRCRRPKTSPARCFSVPR